LPIRYACKPIRSAVLLAILTVGLALPASAPARDLGCFVGIDVSARDERLPSPCVVLPLGRPVAGPVAAGRNQVAFSGNTALVRDGRTGRTRALALPARPYRARAFSDGSVWYTAGPGLLRVTPAGGLEGYSTQGIQATGDLVEGPDGAVWFAGGSFLGRLAGGQLLAFHLEGLQSGPGLTFGPDGRLWFSAGSALGSAGPGGVRVVPLPSGLKADGGITAADGAVWFTDSSGRIGRVTPEGAVESFAAGGSATRIVSGADDRTLWYTAGGSIVRMVTRTFTRGAALRHRCDPRQPWACPFAYGSLAQGTVAAFSVLGTPQDIARGSDQRIYSTQGGRLVAIEPFRGALLCGTRPRTVAHSPGVQGACGRANPTFAVINTGAAYVRVSCPRLTLRFCAGTLKLFVGSRLIGQGPFVVASYDSPAVRVTLNRFGRRARTARTRVRGVLEVTDQGGLRRVREVSFFIGPRGDGKT
jgi:hypothetical protein